MPRKPPGNRLWLAAALAMPIVANAQGSNAHRMDVEARVDAIVASVSALQAGAGFTTPVGTYLRSGMVTGVGAGRDGLSGRIDFINRFHLDPFREHRWAPYGGGGLSARFDESRLGRVYLLVFAGVDGPVHHGFTTSVEAGLGGGGRIGVIIRRAAAERRR
ncbi:MAG: hypothetical protein Q7S20_12195 [Gemmatimonadaceae bacterium]|nr:hypothetical protein [Gemmatimonadaceae bacterium]